MIHVPASLIERIKTRQTVLVTGMGCCELAGLPGWADLTERLLQWLDPPDVRESVQALFDMGRQPAALAYLRAKLPDEAVAEVVREAYGQAVEPPHAFRMVARIPWRGVVTCTFDDLWDRALADDAANPTKVFLAAEAADLKEHRGRFLLHLFGSMVAPDTLCMAPADVRRKVTPTGVGEFLDEIYRKRSFVFVGFRPGDPDLTMLSERLLGANVNEAEHFLLYPGSPNLESELIQAEFGLTPVPFDGGLDEALDALADTWASVEAESRPAEDDFESWVEILGRDPSDDEAVRVLDRLETRLRRERNWVRLVDVKLGRVELLPDARAQVASLRDVGRIYDAEMDAPDKAYTALSMAFRLEHGDPELLDELKAVVGRAGLWNEFLGEYTELVKEITDKDEVIRHWLEIGRIYAEEVNNFDYAVASFQHVLGMDPQSTAAMEPLGELLARRERWADLVPVLQAHAAAETRRERKAELLLQLADVYSVHLGDVNTGVAAYERVLNLDPRNEDAMTALERLYRKMEKWKDLAGVMEMHAEIAADPADAARLKKEAATLLADRVGDVDASIRSLEAVLAGDPGNKQALRSLENLYDKAGRQEDYLRTLEQLVDLADSDGEKVIRLRKMAVEWESRADGADRAAEALEQLLQIDVHDDDAFRGLVRVYRNAKRWHALSEAYLRQIDSADNPVAKRELYRGLGKLYQDDLGDKGNAVEAFVAAANLGDESEQTLGALASLYEQQESWRSCVQMLDKLFDVLGDPAARTAAAFRAGVILAEKLDDRQGAEKRLAAALESDPGHVPSLTALARLYKAKGEYLRAAKLMLETESRTQNRIERTRLLYEAGVLYQDNLDDDEKALELFRAALESDPEHVEAGWRLAELLEQREQWAAVEPLLDMLVRKVDRNDAEYAASIHCRLATAAKRLGNDDKALRAYQGAYQLAPESLEVLIGYADILSEAKDWSGARDIYRQVLRLHQPTLAKPQLVEIYNRLGKCEAERGDVDPAITWYEKAFSVDARNVSAVTAIAGLHELKGDWAALVMDKRTLSGLMEGEAKARLCEEIGDIYDEHLQNPIQAITSYQAAIELQPGRAVMLKLLDLYTRQKRWQPATELLSRVAEQETEPTVRAKYFYAAAAIARDEMHDGYRAVELFSNSLDDDPSNVKAFDAVERILTDAHDWKELARAYRKMIKRLPADASAELKLRLWGGLADVCITHLDDQDTATTALEVVTQLDRNAVERHEQLAELYVQAGPDALDKAIAEHQFLVAKNPDRLGSYRALARLYAEAGARDKLYCMAATLSFLKKADPDLQALYNRHKPQGFQSAKRKFNDDLWAKVVHPEEDRLIGLIFAGVGHFIAATSAQQHQAVNLRRQNRADLMKDERMPGRALRYASDTLGLPAPDLFYNADEPLGLSLYNLQEKGILTPAFVIGQALMNRTNEREVIFETGRRMAFLRPERFVRYAMPTPAALEIGLRAALALAGVSMPFEQQGEVDKLTNLLQRLVPKPVIDQLAMIARKLVAARGDKLEIQSWMAAADLTAARAGFVLANELGSAARVISSETGTSSPLSQKQKLRDLLAFSVSEEYFAIRKALGLEVA